MILRVIFFVSYDVINALSSASALASMVMCPDHPGLTFNLSLVRTEPTYNQPIQQWTFVSDFAVSAHS